MNRPTPLGMAFICAAGLNTCGATIALAALGPNNAARLAMWCVVASGMALMLIAALAAAALQDHNHPRTFTHPPAPRPHIRVVRDELGAGRDL